MANYSRNLSRWYLDTGKALARERGLYSRNADSAERANYLDDKRRTRVALLASRVKNLRQYFTGFESADGFSLNEIKRWPASRAKKVDQYAEYLSHLQSQKHKRVIPRTADQREVLSAFTGQTLANQKAYVVHVESDRDQVKLTPRGDLSIVRDIPSREKVQVFETYYLFQFYLGWRPATWTQVEQATEDILPYLPDDSQSRYFLYSELHGTLGAGQPKQSLLAVVRRYAYEYAAKKFADTIIGFKRAGTSAQADAWYQRRVAYSQQRQEERQKAWNALRRQMRRKR